LAQQLEDKETFLDLTLTPFEPLTPGNRQNIREKKEKLTNAICPGYDVLGYCGAGFKGLFTLGIGPGTRRSVIPLKPRHCPSCPYTIPVNPSGHGSNGKSNHFTRKIRDRKK
jgi:hypothetical protein